MFWIIASLYSGSLWWARLNAAASGAARPLTFFGRLRWCVFVGFCCGCALSVKHTGLAAAGVVLLESFLGMAVLTQPALLWELIAIAATVVVTFFGWFWVFFTFVALKR